MVQALTLALFKASCATMATASLLLATGSCILFLLARHNFSKHNNTISIHESHTGEALAILEAVAHQWLLRLESTFGHLVGLQAVRVFHFLATCLFAHLPNDLRDSPC